MSGSLFDSADVARRSRAIELRLHHEHMGAEWFRSERVVGARCYPDRFGGNLAGMRDEIDYLRSLGVTLLHLLDVVVDVDGERRIDPSLGSDERLSALAADLHLAGIALALDVPAESLEQAGTEIIWLAQLGVDAFFIDTDEDTATELRFLAETAAPSAIVIGPGGQVGNRAHDEQSESATLWAALATRDASQLIESLVAHAGEDRIVAVRDHDALRWNDDAQGRRLRAFYAGEVPGSYSAGLAHRDRVHVSGSAAALAGVATTGFAGEQRLVLAHALVLSMGGIPVLYLGDEVAQPSDPTYAEDPARRGDERWVHRGNKPRDKYAQRNDRGTAAGRVFSRLSNLIAARRSAPEFAGSDLEPFVTGDHAIAGFLRPRDAGGVLVLANVSDYPRTVTAHALEGFERTAHDLLDRWPVNLTRGVTVPARGIRWLRVTRTPTPDEDPTDDDGGTGSGQEVPNVVTDVVRTTDGGVMMDNGSDGE